MPKAVNKLIKNLATAKPIKLRSSPNTRYGAIRIWNESNVGLAKANDTLHIQWLVKAITAQLDKEPIGCPTLYLTNFGFPFIITRKSLRVETQNHPNVWENVKMRKSHNTNAWRSAGIRSVADFKSIDAIDFMSLDISWIQRRAESWSKVLSWGRSDRTFIHLWWTNLRRLCDSMSTKATTLVLPALSPKKTNVEWYTFLPLDCSKASPKALQRVRKVSSLLLIGRDNSRMTSPSNSPLLSHKLLKSSK